MNESPRASGMNPAPSGVSGGPSTGASGVSPIVPAGGLVIGPDAAFIGLGCLAVATAELLGVHWLREQVLGIPAGLWLIGLGYGLARIVRDRFGTSKGAMNPTAAVPVGSIDGAVATESSSSVAEAPGQLRLGFDGTAPENGGLKLTHASGQPEGIRSTGSLLEQAGYRLAEVEVTLPAGPRAGGRAVLGLAGMVAPIGRIFGSGPSRISDLLAGWLDSTAWPVRPLRVGVDLHSDLAASLIRAGAGLGIEWVPVGAGSDDRRECASQRLDGVVRLDAVGDICFRTAEHPEREAGWYDWSRPLPLSYSSVFPMRIDPCMVTLSRGWGFEPAEARLISRLIQAAAILSRTRSRLGVTDRLHGRVPVELCGGGEAGDLLRANALVVHAVSNLAESVCRDRSADAFALKAAARVVGAWASTTDVPVDPEVRREAAESALRVLEGEPEAILRAVATRFATYDDDAAFAGALEAERVIRERGEGPILDPLAFIEAEIELGLPGPVTFGRVAAGLSLVCASTEDAKLDYVCDDLVEEMRYSGWLIGRDADRRVLIELLRVLQKARRRGPAKEAA